MASENSFSGQTIIISGAAGVIGGAVSTALAHAGANVVLVDIATDRLDALTARLTTAGRSALACPGSVADADAIVATTLRAFGRIDAIVNATAVNRYGAFETQTPAALQAALDANVLGPLALVRAAWAAFGAQGGGRVVQCASDSIYGMRGAAAYVLTKGALLGVNRTLALEGAPRGVRVNCVAPCAWSPLVQDNFRDLAPDAQRGFQDLFTGDSNIAMILALCHEKCNVSGEVFTTGGWGVGRLVLGTVAGPKGVKTMDECFEKWDEITGKDKTVVEPAGLDEYVQFKMSWLV